MVNKGVGEIGPSGLALGLVDGLEREGAEF